MDTEVLTKNSNNYIFEVKTTNFKIILKKLHETISTLEDLNDVYSCIGITSELVKQYDIIYSKINELVDSDSLSKLKDLEKKNENLNNALKEADDSIYDLDDKYKKELDINKSLQVEINKITTISEKYKSHIDNIETKLKDTVNDNDTKIKELNNVISIKSKEITEIKKQYEEEDKSKTQKTTSYFEKIIEANKQLLYKTNERNKELENNNKKMNIRLTELDTYIKQLDNCIETVKIENDRLINNNKEINNYVTDLERQKIHLISLISGVEKNALSLEDELNIVKIKEEYDIIKGKYKIIEEENRLLKKEIDELKTINIIDKITTPLLNNKNNDKYKNESSKLCICQIM